MEPQRKMLKLPKPLPENVREQKIKELVFRILSKRALIKPSKMNHYVSEEMMPLWISVFTHKSVEGAEHYELMEFEGDVIVNAAVVPYIRERYPKIRRISYLTRIKHNLISKDYLANIFEQENVFPLIKISDEMREYFSNQANYKETTDYLSLLEDTYEAFSGRVANIAKTRFGGGENTSSGIGLGLQLVYNITSSYLDNMTIPVKYEDIFDPKTILKELYDKMGWNMKQTFMTKELVGEGGKVYETRVYGYVLGDRRPIPQNKVLLASFSSFRMKGYKGSEQLAARKALNVLENKYRIWKEIPDPELEI